MEELIKEKAKEIGQKYFPDEHNIWARSNWEAQKVEMACLEMSEWKDKKFMEKAFNWFLENTQVDEPAIKYAPNGQPLAESWILREKAREQAARTMFENFKNYIIL